MAAKLELARWIVARSHGEEAARAAEEHFTRVVREGQAPDEVEEVRLEGPDPVVHLPAFLAAAARRVVEPLAPRHRPGRRQARRPAGVRLRRPVGRARGRDAAGGQAAVPPACTRLTPLRSVLHFPGCPRGRRRKVPANDTTGVASEDDSELKVRASLRPLARVGAFFTPSRRPGL